MRCFIHWCPVAAKGAAFRHGSSAELQHIKNVFGMRVDIGDVNKLREMATEYQNKFYDEIANVVVCNGSIHVWGQY